MCRGWGCQGKRLHLTTCQLYDDYGPAEYFLLPQVCLPDKRGLRARREVVRKKLRYMRYRKLEPGSGLPAGVGG